MGARMSVGLPLYNLDGQYDLHDCSVGELERRWDMLSPKRRERLMDRISNDEDRARYLRDLCGETYFESACGVMTQAERQAVIDLLVNPG